MTGDKVVSIAPRLHEIRFICGRCDTEVFSFAPADHLPICQICRHLDTMPPEDAARAAEFMQHPWKPAQ